MGTASTEICCCGQPLEIPQGYAHAFCNACKSFRFPGEIEDSEDAIVPLGRATSFACPRCYTELVVGRIGKTEVCFCDTCRGFVVDSESLGGLIQSRRANYTGPEDKPVLVDLRELEVRGVCPACLSNMEAHHYCGPGNIVIDTCMTCKLAWLDHGELAKIIRAPGRR